MLTRGCGEGETCQHSLEIVVVVVRWSPYNITRNAPKSARCLGAATNESQLTDIYAQLGGWEWYFGGGERADELVVAPG